MQHSFRIVRLNALLGVELLDHEVADFGGRVTHPTGAEAFAQKLEKELNGGAIQIQYATPISKYRYGGRIFMEETQESLQIDIPFQSGFH